MQPTVKTEVLLAILQENRAKHRKVFEAAWVNYQQEAERLFTEQLALLKAGKLRRVYVSLPEPKDHTSDYDRAIRMVGLHQEPTIKLTEQDASQLIQDDWSWKREWLTTSTAYAAETVKDFYEAVAE